MKKWAILFDDAEMHPEIYTDEDAARKRYELLVNNWNCYLFEQCKDLHMGENCICRSYNNRTGEHAESCPCNLVHYLPDHQSGHICGISLSENSTYISDEVTCQKCKEILDNSAE